MSERAKGNVTRRRWRRIAWLVASSCLAMMSAVSRIHAQVSQEIPHLLPWSALGAGMRAAVTDAVQRESPELAARRATLTAAESRVRAARYGPAMALSGEIEEVPDGVNVANAGSARLEVSRDFVSSGLRAARRDLATAGVDAARVALDVAQRRAIIRVEELAIRAAAAVLIARRFAAEDSLLADAEEALRLRFGVGEARYVDILRLRTQRLEVQTERAALLTEARVSRQSLRALIAGESANAQAVSLADTLIQRLVQLSLTAPAGQPAWGALPAAPGVDSLVAMSGAVRLAVTETQRAQAARRLALAERRPQLSAALGAQRFDDGDGHHIGPTLGLSISLPFTARGLHAATLAAAEQDMVAAGAFVRAATLAARTELAAARERYEAIRERLSIYDSALLRGARDERETALSAYRTGELSLLELLDFERALARAEIAQLRGRSEAADALADLLTGASGNAAADAAHEHSINLQERAR